MWCDADNSCWSLLLLGGSPLYPCILPLPLLQRPQATPIYKLACQIYGRSFSQHWSITKNCDFVTTGLIMDDQLQEENDADVRIWVEGAAFCHPFGGESTNLGWLVDLKFIGLLSLSPPNYGLKNLFTHHPFFFVFFALPDKLQPVQSSRLARITRAPHTKRMGQSDPSFINFQTFYPARFPTRQFGSLQPRCNSCHYFWFGLDGLGARSQNNASDVRRFKRCVWQCHSRPLGTGSHGCRRFGCLDQEFETIFAWQLDQRKPTKVEGIDEQPTQCSGATVRQQKMHGLSTSRQPKQVAVPTLPAVKSRRDEQQQQQQQQQQCHFHHHQQQHGCSGGDELEQQSSQQCDQWCSLNGIV